MLNTALKYDNSDDFTPVDLPARYLINGRGDYKGTLLAISPDIAQIVSHTSRPFVDDKVVFYVDQSLRLEGRVANSNFEAFGVELKLNSDRRKKLIEALKLVEQGEKLTIAFERRRGVRYAPVESYAHILLENSKVLECRVLSLSVSGAILEVKERLPLGMVIQVGRMRGRVIRYTDSGIAIEFLNALCSANKTRKLQL